MAMAKLQLFMISSTLLSSVFPAWAQVRQPQWQGPTPRDRASLIEELRADVTTLASKIGERNALTYENLKRAEAFLRDELESAGLTVREQEFTLTQSRRRDEEGLDAGKVYRNLEVEWRGTETPEEIVVIGAHYDSALGSPGANDNATGTAAALALGRLFKNSQPKKTLRFVFFANEEPPFFQTPDMGSVVYARASRARGEKIVAMLSLETMGYYSNVPGSQQVPVPGLDIPNVGNFIGFVGNIASQELLKTVFSLFDKTGLIPAQSAALPDEFPIAGFSDQWSFWEQGYPGLMVTDTAFLRYPYYHTPEDTPDKVDFALLARVVEGLSHVTASLARVPQ